MYCIGIDVQGDVDGMQGVAIFSQKLKEIIAHFMQMYVLHLH